MSDEVLIERGNWNKKGVISVITIVVIVVLFGVFMSRDKRQETPESAFEWCRSFESDNACEIEGLIDESLTEICIPKKIEGKRVVAILQDAFLGNENLTSVDIPEGVKVIENGAFDYCSNLSRVVLPDSVQHIGAAFSECTSLIEIQLPDGLVSLEDAFWCCKNLERIVIPDGVTEIDDFTFGGCSSLCEIKLSKNLAHIGEQAFIGCKKLESVQIPDGVISIDDYAFWKCSGLKEIELPSSLTSIGEDVFYGCDSLTRILVTRGSYAEQWAEENGYVDILEFK